jgi:hypothetical protein
MDDGQATKRFASNPFGYAARQLEIFLDLMASQTASTSHFLFGLFPFLVILTIFFSSVHSNAPFVQNRCPLPLASSLDRRQTLPLVGAVLSGATRRHARQLGRVSRVSEAARLQASTATCRQRSRSKCHPA